jgi:hypothetical protein
MIAFYYLYDAKKRMKEIQQFIKRTPDIPMLLAQRDIIQKEIDYYREKSWDLVYFVLTLTALCIILYVYYSIGFVIFHIMRMF